MDDQARFPQVVELAAELTIAWLTNANNRAQTADVAEFLRTIAATLNALSSADETEVSISDDDPARPAVSVRKSLASPEQIISLIDGKPYKSLKRHLSRHGLTPETYREKFGLKADYPMVAPAYAEKRRALARSIGLGRRPKDGSQDRPSPQSGTKRQRKPKAPVDSSSN